MSLVKSQLRRQTVCCHFDVGGHNRAHGGRVPRVPRGGYAPDGKCSVVAATPIDRLQSVNMHWSVAFSGV